MFLLRYIGPLLLWGSVLLSAFRHGPTSATPLPQNAPVFSGQEVVAERSWTVDAQGRIGHGAIVVDRDSNVREYLWFEERDHSLSSPKALAYLGQRLSESGTLPLRGLLPEGMVAVRAARVTYDSDATYHAVVAWGYEKVGDAPIAGYGVFVLLQKGGHSDARLVFKDEGVNEELQDFLVRDFGSDGTTEIVDIGRSGHVVSATVREIGRDGRVKKLQVLDAFRITIFGDSFTQGGYQAYLEDVEPNGPDPRKLCYRFRVLNWSKEARLFLSDKR